jgi:glyoxylase-like metal-dependent hydrolase (beta-lactamase superfamily II)
MTHLHFDHCGGSVQWNKDKTGYEPAFKNAKFWSNDSHWEWATKPNPREGFFCLKIFCQCKAGLILSKDHLVTIRTRIQFFC